VPKFGPNFTRQGDGGADMAWFLVLEGKNRSARLDGKEL
jgi:hypothetical protein